MPSGRVSILLSMLTTDQKGAIAEQAIALAAVELGIGVARPLGDERYDLIFDTRECLLRVQCKWACRRGDVVVVRCTSARRNAEGFVRRLYRPEEVDAFAAYCAEIRRSYFIRFESVPPGGTLQLQLSRPRNNQARAVRWADQYEFVATLDRTDGAIAQLGERLAGSQKGTGSSPVGSM
jgi:PD-(D/E)XK endonuclease